VKKLLLSSASRVPELTNLDEAKADAAAGAELLKTLGFKSAVPDRTPAGLIGVRLQSLRESGLGKYVGLKDGDLLLGMDGWNVNNDREVGWAFRASRMQLPSSRTPLEGTWPSKGTLWALIRRGSQTGLYEIPPAGSPMPDSAKPSKATPPAKASTEGSFPDRRFRGRRPVPVPIAE